MHLLMQIEDNVADFLEDEYWDDGYKKVIRHVKSIAQSWYGDNTNNKKMGRRDI